MTDNTRARRAHLPGSVSLAALVLTALALCASLVLPPARAAEWMEPYLEIVQEWGVMRGDSSGNLHEDRPITRAEFVTLVNRAFGYTDVGPHTFADVNPNDWFAEDISIAHQAGYFNGTNPTTASPYSLVTREQAAVFLGRCLRFQGVTGAANSSFADMQDIGGWSRGLVQEAAELGIIQGYSDGTFRPKENITRGQMACFLVRALGTLVQEPGEQTSGGVYGNLTITTPGVKLKDTTITGNLYLTGGVGLGNVELENVEVLGKIVVCGGGEAEGGKHSVVLRNVTAESLVLDSITGQFLSLEAEGLTNIQDISVRSSAYIEDRTEDGLGLQTIRLDGVDGSQFQLAGNLKRIIDFTPNSKLQIAQGVADVVTIDEKAEGATVTIDNLASIRELNLDRATKVDGEGSISHLNVNAPGSTVSMLPDTIYVRPGITANINKVVMDNKIAAESSEDPRILAGYPKARNIAPTSANALFRTNKAGTIHWALTALMDGSVGEEELMDPGSYPKIIRSGTIKATAANTDFTARLTGLTKEGSYYISALLEDARGRRSPVKVAAFTTPDDTAPNFASGYPQAPILTQDADKEQVAQIMVMATKSCQMYYALFPKGSTAPTAADFRTAALPGNLGYGVVDLKKNTPFLVSRINTSHLQEKTQYDLYLWLNDADNGKSSAVKKITFTTKDLTAPTIQDLHMVSNAARTVTMSFTLDEPGTLNWVVVEKGYNPGINLENPTKRDQMRIESGILVGGKVVRKGGPVRAAKGGTAYTFTVSGLQPETSYDLFYMAKDTAGNYCVYNKTIDFPYPIKTLDTAGPKATLDYSDKATDANGVDRPWADSDIYIQFSEVVQGAGAKNADAPDDFYALYQRVEGSSGTAQAAAKRDLANVLQKYLSFYTGTPPSGANAKPRPETKVTVKDGTQSADQLAKLSSWIDYREAIVSQEGGKTTITFPGKAVGIKLQGDTKYYFRLENIIDTSNNSMESPTHLPFSTASATVNLDHNSTRNVTYTNRTTGQSVTCSDARVFTLDPRNTQTVSKDTRWDMLIWTDSSIQYDLLVRLESQTEWTHLGNIKLSMADRTGDIYASLNGNFNSVMAGTGLFGSFQAGKGELPFLHEFLDKMVFAVAPTTPVEKTVNMKVEIRKGSNYELSYVSQPSGNATLLKNRDVPSIGDPDPFTFQFDRNRAPSVTVNFKTIHTESDKATAEVTITPTGNLYYLAFPLSNASGAAGPVVSGSNYIPRSPGNLGRPEVNGQQPAVEDVPDSTTTDVLMLDGPAAIDVLDLVNEFMTVGSSQEGIDYGKITSQRTAKLELDGLLANTTYFLYLVTQDRELPTVAAQIVCYKFTTQPPAPPKMYIATTSTTSATLQLDKDSTDVKYLLARTYQLEKDEKFNKTFAGLGTMLKEPLPNIYGGGSISVLKAMLDSYPGQTGKYQETVFDHCASDETKAEYARYLRSLQNDMFEPPALTPTDPFSLNKDALYPITITDMETIEPFTMIVVATGKDSGLDGFRASPAFRVTQDKNLYVQNWSASPNDATTETHYFGNFTVYFTDTLCYQNGSGKYVNVDACSMSQLHPEASNGIDTTNKVINYPNVFSFTNTNQISLYSPTPHSNVTRHGAKVTNRLEFKMTGAQNNQQIVFQPLICGTNGEVKAGRSSLIITLRKPDAEHPDWWLSFTDGWQK